jgi:arginyl-tRNA synthetase
VRLKDLLDEAEARALSIVQEKSPDLGEAQQREVARVIGIASVKYFDLSQSRTSDYVFSWDKMLAMQGNTAPYMQYAYVRIRSIFRKAEQEALFTRHLMRCCWNNPLKSNWRSSSCAFPSRLIQR